ncbi:DUF262 domain-containing protein [Streptomyces sp. DSM 40907]|uniref:DUF262 domain-containing protein n=1 Tax=Streptomyces kutzneri TaxID=3051179 RepID=UPI0028D04640|nr:DUF262 domain-containing protein [Streptomyces sp. DSM 40907]
MDEFNVNTLRNSSVAYLHQQRNQIELNPVYQRQSGVWSVEKQQLLIDSIINGFDIPKIYFHEFVVRREVDGKRLRYAIVDGKQRMQAIWEFLDDRYPLASDFEYFEDKAVAAAGMKFSQLAQEYPDIAALFNATTLSVVTIRTDDIEIIEEMFSRLNEAAPLNAAEKRNALGGPLPAAVRKLSEHEFFTEKIPFANSRYRHFDLAAKFLYWAHEGGAADAKKFHLDSFFESKKRDSDGEQRVAEASVKATSTLDLLCADFNDGDKLLSQVGMVSIYYLLYLGAESGYSRDVFDDFNQARDINRKAAERDMSEAEFELLEFDRYSQSPNDGTALEYRLDVLQRWIDRQD